MRKRDIPSFKPALYTSNLPKTETKIPEIHSEKQTWWNRICPNIL